MRTEKNGQIAAAMFAGILVAAAGMLFLPKLLGLQELAVISGSMAPEIPTGSMVYVRDVKPENLCLGDVCTYRLADSDVLVTHRVIGTDRENQTLITKGDANTIADAAVSFGQVVGRVEFHLPCMGQIALCVQTPLGLMMLSGIAVWALLVFWNQEETL